MKYSINLGNNKNNTRFDKTLYFLLHYVRYILVITQLVVLGVLFYRFKIDQEISDLKYSLQQKNGFLTVTKPLVKDAAIINSQLTTAKQIISHQETMRTAGEDVLSKFPQDMFLSKLTINNTSLELIGSTINAVQLQSYYQTLLKSKKYKSVVLSQVERRATGYIFTLKVDVKKEPYEL